MGRTLSALALPWRRRERAALARFNDTFSHPLRGFLARQNARFSRVVSEIALGALATRRKQPPKE